ncbi:MAG TPA: nickel pincer cofactor biosynthesis protein LarC [Dehalococcoidia bacterium]|nr:nickel pincer cofactor biosynthesis protein LarC [Dehalococcoidia bacterium]
MKVAYIQSIGGASGDMLLGAFLDLGVPLDTLVTELNKLGLNKLGLNKPGISGFTLSANPDTRCEVRGTRLGVSLDDPQRLSPRSLLETVTGSSLSAAVKDCAGRVLTALWQAESRVHGEPPESLELDELGTVDTLVDVVGVAICLDYLGVERVYAAPLVLGESAPPRWAGGYSNPAPATLELVTMAAAPIVADRPLYQGAGELTTPTGAAIITTLAEFQRPAMVVAKIGVGLGSKDPKNFPNVVRVWLGETADILDLRSQAGIVLLETNLDDVTGEVLGYAQERLFALGALDVWHTSIQMKKDRPGTILSALVPQSLESAAVELILQETPTLGVRTRPVERYVAGRESVTMATELGSISVKIKWFHGKPVSVSPEYEDCRRIALESGLPLQEIYQRMTEESRKRFRVR